MGYLMRGETEKVLDLAMKTVVDWRDRVHSLQDVLVRGRQDLVYTFTSHPKPLLQRG